MQSVLHVKRLMFGEKERKKKVWKGDMPKSSLLLTKADFIVFPSGESAHLPPVPLNKDRREQLSPQFPRQTLYALHPDLNECDLSPLTFDFPLKMGVL